MTSSVPGVKHKNSLFEVSSPNIHDAIVYLDSLAPEPHKGLPQELFYFVSRMTPMVNVDLLVKDEKGRVLLAWRNDSFAGSAWHLPGGIVRYKEKFEERLLKVAQSELGTAVEFDAQPLSIHQVLCGHKTRGHFISVLFNCHLSAEFVPENKGLSSNDAGFLQWHDLCPANLVKVHEMYRDYL